MSAATVPPLHPVPEVRLPAQAQTRLANGLKVVAVQSPGVSLVELRLRIPLPTVPRSVVALLAGTLVGGTAASTRAQINARLQQVGGQLSTTVDADQLLISGGCLAGGLGGLLAALAELLCQPAYPEPEVMLARAQLAEHQRLMKAQPDTIVFEALNARVHPDHPYAAPGPAAAELLALQPSDLRTWHARRLGPQAATLVLVGDLAPESAVAAAQAELAGWTAGEAPPPLPPVPPLEPGPLELVHHPEPVQAAIRMAFRAVGRTHPDHAALCLANLVLGGYFSSRLVANLRESRGYAYQAGSILIHASAGSAIMISANVPPPLAAAAWWEIHAELGRLVSAPIDATEIAQARQYALGAVQLRLASQRGLAEQTVNLAADGLGLDWLHQYVDGLQKATDQEVHAAARRYLAPTRPVSVLLGDAAAVQPQLALLGPVRLR